MELPPASILEWIKTTSLNPDYWGKDALTWRNLAQKAGIDLSPELGGLGRGIQKITAKSELPKSLLATSELAEMATQGSVSKYRFESFLKNLDLTDIQGLYLPTCGAGLDALHLYDHLKSHSPQIWVSDLNPLTTWICQENFQRLHPQNSIEFDSKDAFEFDKNTQSSYAFFDPARREKGEKLLQSYSPDLKKSMDFLQTFRYAQIKLSPGESIGELVQHFPKWSWQIIQLGSEIKEINGQYGYDEGQIEAVQLNHLGELISSFRRPYSPPSYTPDTDIEPGDTLCLPEVVLRQSSLIGLWLEENAVTSTAYEGLYLKTTQSPQSLKLCKEFKLVDMASLKAGTIKKLLKASPYPVELRSLGVRPDSKIEKSLQSFNKEKGKTTQKWTLLLCRSDKSQKALLLRGSPKS